MLYDFKVVGIKPRDHGAATYLINFNYKPRTVTAWSNLSRHVFIIFALTFVRLREEFH